MDSSTCSKLSCWVTERVCARARDNDSISPTVDSFFTSPRFKGLHNLRAVISRLDWTFFYGAKKCESLAERGLNRLLSKQGFALFFLLILKTYKILCLHWCHRSSQDWEVLQCWRVNTCRHCLVMSFAELKRDWSESSGITLFRQNVNARDKALVLKC